MIESTHPFFSMEHLVEQTATKTTIKDRRKRFVRSFSLGKYNRLRSEKYSSDLPTTDRKNKLDISDIVNKLVHIDLNSNDHEPSTARSNSDRDKQKWFARSFSLRKHKKLKPNNNSPEFPLLGNNTPKIKDHPKEMTKSLDTDQFSISSEVEGLEGIDLTDSHPKTSFKHKTQRIIKLVSFKKHNKSGTSDDSSSSSPEEPIYAKIYVKRNEQPKAIRTLRNRTKIFLNRWSSINVSRPYELETFL